MRNKFHYFKVNWDQAMAEFLKQKGRIGIKTDKALCKTSGPLTNHNVENGRNALTNHYVA